MSEIMKKSDFWQESILIDKFLQPVLIHFKEIDSQEKFNSYSHLLGIFLGIVGTIYLLSKAQTSWILFSFSLAYGFSIIFLFLASTLWHSVKLNAGKPSIWRKLDHVGILLLISATRNWIWIFDNTLELRILLIHWVIVGISIVLFIKFENIPRWMYTSFYIFLGWISIAYLLPLFEVLPKQIIWLMISGGTIYTIGAGFFLLKKPSYFHEIFHVLVLIATALFYIAIVQLMF